MNRARQIRNRERNRHGRIYKRIGGWSIGAFNNGEGISQSIHTTNRLIAGDAFFIVIIRASLCGCFNEAAIHLNGTGRGIQEIAVIGNLGEGGRKNAIQLLRGRFAMQYIRERISTVILSELLCDLVADGSYSGNKGAVIVGRDGLDSRDNIRCLSHAAKLIILESDTQTETGTKRTVTGRDDHRVRRVCRSFGRGQGDKLVFIVEIDTLYIHAGSRIIGVAEDIRAVAVLPDTGREHRVRGNGFGDAGTEKCTAQADILTVRSVNIAIGGIEGVPNTLSPMELIISITPEHEVLQLTAYGVGDGDHITGSRDRGLLHAVDLRIHTEQLGELHVKRGRIYLNDTVIDHRGQETINRGRFSTNVGKAVINGGIEIINMIDHGVFKVPDAFDSQLDIIHEQDLIVRDQNV